MRVDDERTVEEKLAVDCRREAEGGGGPRAGSAAAVADTLGRREREREEEGAVPSAVMEIDPEPEAAERYERTVSIPFPSGGSAEGVSATEKVGAVKESSDSRSGGRRAISGE